MRTTLFFAALCIATPAIAGDATAGKVVRTFAWGGSDGQLGGPTQAAGRFGEGVPTAFLESGTSLEILDAVNHRVLTCVRDGACTALALSGLVADDALLIDCARHDGHLFVADRTRNEVIQVTPAGKVVNRFGGFAGVARLEPGPKGHGVIVADRVRLQIFELGDGKARTLSEHPDATPLMTAAGDLAAARVVADRWFVIGLAAPGSVPRPRVAIPSHAASSDIIGGELAGIDAAGRIVAVVTEGRGDKIHGAWAYTIGPGGQIDSEARVPEVLDRLATLPRFFRPAADGLLGFRMDASGFSVVRYPLAGTPSVRPETIPAADEARKAVEDALCAGSPSRPAVVTAAARALLADPFEPESSRALEGELALAGGNLEPAGLTELCAIRRARKLATAGRWDEVVALVTPARKSAKHVKDDLLFLEAQALEATGKKDQALRLYQELVLGHPDSRHYSASQDAVIKLAGPPPSPAR